MVASVALLQPEIPVDSSSTAQLQHSSAPAIVATQCQQHLGPPLVETTLLGSSERNVQSLLAINASLQDAGNHKPPATPKVAESAAIVAAAPAVVLAPTPNFRGVFPVQDDVDDVKYDLFDPPTTDSEVDYKSAVRRKVVDAVNRHEAVLLAQKPGFGKTRLMLELCTRDRFTMIFAPTKPLQKQVNA